jgi:23S rRNA G2445 N2-methylase RlmL
MAQNPTEKLLTFRGLEKNATTIRLAKMNLAVHGLEGDIQKAITYYEDPHELLGKADYVMANPPFQRGRDRRRQGQERPAPALRPARRQQEGQGQQRQLRLDQLFLQLPERQGPGRVRHVLPGLQRRAATRPRCARSWSRPATWMS